MKHITGVLLFLLFTLALMHTAYAAPAESMIIDTDQLERRQPEEATTVYGVLKVTDTIDARSSLNKLWDHILLQIKELTASALQNGARIVLISFVSVLCCSVSDSRVLPFVGAASVALVCMKNVASCAVVGRQALQTLTDYSHVLLPCLATAAAAGGAWTSAGAKYAASAMAMDMMITTEQNLAVPVLYAYASTAIAAKLTQNPLMQSLEGFMRSVIKWSLLLLTGGFTLYLSITGILTGTVDAAAAKAAKTVISGVLPVVGGMLADASGAVLAGAQMLRNGVGIIGMLVILAVCVSPYLMLGSHYLVYQIAGGFASSFGDQRIGGVIRCIGDVFGFLLGIVGCVSVMLFVSVISLMKAVTPG